MSIKKVTTNNNEVRWEVRVYEDGRGSKEVRKRFERKIDAERFESQFEKLKAERETNPWFRESNFKRSFREEFDYWYSDAQHRMSPGTRKRVTGFVTEFMEELGARSLDYFTPETLSKIQRRQKDSGLSNGTVNRKVNIILAVLNHSARHRRIPFNPAMGLKKLNEDSPEMKFWSVEEAQNFLAKMSERYPEGSPDRWVYVVYLLALNTALRAGEIWGLKPMDINFQKKLILVRRQFDRVARDISTTKGGGGRAVPCNEELAMELKALIERGQIKSDEPIFRNENEGFVNHDNFKKRKFAKDLEAWEGRKIRFHDMRHTATTLMIASGVDLKTVKEICGHSEIDTTMGYVHLVDGMIEKVAQTFSVSGVGKVAESPKQDSKEQESSLDSVGVRQAVGYL